MLVVNVCISIQCCLTLLLLLIDGSRRGDRVAALAPSWPVFAWRVSHFFLRIVDFGCLGCFWWLKGLIDGKTCLLVSRLRCSVADSSALCRVVIPLAALTLCIPCFDSCCELVLTAACYFVCWLSAIAFMSTSCALARILLIVIW